MNIQKNVLTISRNNNIFILIKLTTKYYKRSNSKKSKNFTMITLIRRPIHKVNQVAITFGSIMSVQFGCQSVILSKKMVPSMLKEYKTQKKNGTSMNALYVKNLKEGLASNVKIHNVESITILNVLVKRKYIWNNSTCKRLNTLFFVKSMNLSKLPDKLNIRKRKIGMKS